jgi:hypothetical protein
VAVLASSQRGIEVKMATTKFKGSLRSVNGFYFHPASYSSARAMTITCTSLIRSAASSPAQSATLTNAMCGGLSKISACWGNVRQRTAATCLFVCGRPLGAANSAVVNLHSNVGIGNLFEGRNCTVDVFCLGYVS